MPAAGRGTRIQPLAFSKELLPVGSRLENGTERPCAVSEYLVERMIRGGADKIAFVIAPGKSDILEYYGGRYGDVPLAYVVQPEPLGLCDALFSAAPLIAPDEAVLVGLPDTVWMPASGFAALQDGGLSLLLFPVEDPSAFDAVVCDPDGRVLAIDVKSASARSRWIWGGFRMPGRVLTELHRLWLSRGRADEYVGTLVNAWIEAGGEAIGVPAGEAYVDVGTLNGYRAALRLLSDGDAAPQTGPPAGRVSLSWPTGRPLAGLHAPPAGRSE